MPLERVGRGWVNQGKRGDYITLSISREQLLGVMELPTDGDYVKFLLFENGYKRDERDADYLVNFAIPDEVDPREAAEPEDPFEKGGGPAAHEDPFARPKATPKRAVPTSRPSGTTRSAVPARGKKQIKRS